MQQRTPHSTRMNYGRALAWALLLAACHSRELGPEGGGGSASGGRNGTDGPPLESSARPWVDVDDPSAVVGHVRVRRPRHGISGLGGGSSTPGGGATSIGGKPWISGSGGAPSGGQPTAGAGGSSGTGNATAGASSGGSGAVPPVDTDLGPGPITRFAVIGDYGSGTQSEGEVARLVRSFDPEFIVTTGDNNYPVGSAETIDANIGQFYHAFIHPYRGKYGGGATENRFFPTLGNHDWYTANAQPYLDYFTLPGNERYYDIVRGNVHYFALDSDVNEPDGITSDSVQGRWCEATARGSTTPFRVAAMHHPPYSSSSHGSTPTAQWPYRAWGFDLVLGGHDHTYERFEIDGITYVVNGLGGQHVYSFGTPLPGSVARSNEKEGALFVEASATRLVGRFVDTSGTERDVFAIERR